MYIHSSFYQDYANIIYARQSFNTELQQTFYATVTNQYLVLSNSMRNARANCYIR